MVTALYKHKRLLALFLIGLLLGVSPALGAKELSSYLNNYYNNMGMKVLAYGFRALAGEHFKQVLAAEPDNYEVRLLLTMILMEEGELERALIQCESLRKSPAVDATVIVLEGQIRQRLGQLEKASALYQEALAENEELATAQLGLAQIWALQGEEAKAQVAYETVVKLSPERLDAYLELADLQQKKGAFSQAVDTLKDGIAINRQWAPLHHKLALIYQLEGKHDEAKVAMERARQLDPDSVAGEA